MAKKLRKVSIGGIKITKQEDDLLNEFGNSSPGYDIPCRFCGWKSVYHDEEASQKFEPEEKQKHEPGSDVRRKGFRTTLQNCANNIQYVPKNIGWWRRENRADQRGEWG